MEAGTIDTAINMLTSYFLTHVPGLTPWEAVGFYALSFFTSGMTAAAGIGGGLVLLAAMTTVYAPGVLIPVHAVIQVGSNGGRAIMMRRDILFLHIPAFTLGSMIGGFAGAQIFAELPVSLLRALLALFILYAAWAPMPRFLRPSKRMFFGLGTITSFLGIFVGGTGPMLAPVIAAASPTRHGIVATHAAMMTLHHITRIAAFGLIGFAFGPYLGFIIGMIVTGLIGTMVGRQFLNRLPEKTFRVVFKTILTVLAVRLLYSAVI